VRRTAGIGVYLLIFVLQSSLNGSSLGIAVSSSRPAVPVTIHNGYTSGTEDCPFCVEAMPTLPSSAIFPRLSIPAWPPWYRKG
jgi:hypothetical protein